MSTPFKPKWPSGKITFGRGRKYDYEALYQISTCKALGECNGIMGKFYSHVTGKRPTAMAPTHYHRHWVSSFSMLTAANYPDHRLYWSLIKAGQALMEDTRLGSLPPPSAPFCLTQEERERSLSSVWASGRVQSLCISRSGCVQECPVH